MNDKLEDFRESLDALIDGYVLAGVHPLAVLGSLHVKATGMACEYDISGEIGMNDEMDGCGRN